MSMERGTRTRLTTILILFLVLLTGSVLGIAVDRRLEARASSGETGWRGSVETRGEEGRRGGERQGDEGPRRVSIVEQVGLSEIQKAQVDSIVAHYRREMRDLEAELQRDLQAAYMPRYRTLVEETRAEIKKILTPEQRTVYDSLLVEHDQRREQRRPRDSISEPGR